MLCLRIDMLAATVAALSPARHRPPRSIEISTTSIMYVSPTLAGHSYSVLV